MAKAKENPNRVVTFLSDRQMAILKKQKNVPVSASVREAVEQYCKKLEKK